MLADLMVTAIEGGCGYWASDLELVSGTDEYEPPYYADPRFYLSPFKLALTDCMRDVHTIESDRSEEHTSELQSLMRISYAVFCLKKKNKNNTTYKSHLPNSVSTN